MTVTKELIDEALFPFNWECLYIIKTISLIVVKAKHAELYDFFYLGDDEGTKGEIIGRFLHDLSSDLILASSLEELYNAPCLIPRYREIVKNFIFNKQLEGELNA